MGQINIKRIYLPPSDGDGQRILIDRLWPRGLTREKARIDYWPKEIAPSSELRRWYGHEPLKWSEFKERYHNELEENTELVNDLLERIKAGPVTFLFSSKEEKLNNAHALKAFIEARM